MIEEILKAMLDFKINFRNWIRNKVSQGTKENMDFTDLAPTDKIENGKTYLKTLKWALDHKNRIKNIAITGPYGSGKSSIIATFLKRYPNIRRGSLSISLAMFSKSKFAKKDNKKFNEEDIQRSILKQIFYRTSPSKIPLSRYRKLYKPNVLKISAFLLTVISIIFLINYIFNYPSLGQNIKLINTAYTRLINKGILARILWTVIIFTTIISAILIILKLISYLYSRFSISKINLGSMAEADQDTDSSIFDKNMDELMYFFENTGYSIVIFEDLDRWNNNSIFLHLRELNATLNKDELIDEPITFIYAIGDDFFNDDEERTKFFDFIIPVIPVMTSTNAGDFLVEKLKKYDDISDKFIYDISPYISNIRILDNICNEFEVYEPIIIEHQKLQLSKEKLLALIIFKNIYPKDFTDLEGETGIIKEAFNEKTEFVKQTRKDIQKNIDANREKITKIKEEILPSYKDVMSAFLTEIVQYEGSATYFYCKDNNEYTVDKLMSRKENLLDLKNNEISSIGFVNFSTRRNDSQSIYSEDTNRINETVKSFV